MATVNYYIDKKKQKEDGTWRVTIRLTHKGSNKYISTNYFVDKTQINKKMEIKDEDTMDDVRDLLKSYRKKLQALDEIVDTYSCDELKSFLQKNENKRIDYIEFSRKFISEIPVKGTRENAAIALNSFVHFIGDKININDIDLKTLLKYEKYIRSNRTVKQPHNSGKILTRKLKGVTDTGVKQYMTQLKRFYKEAMKLYNDRGSILIPYNPFDKYEMPQVADTPNKDLTIETLRSIRDCPDLTVGKFNRSKAAVMARDCFMLSFYLMGMNAVDLFNVLDYTDGRISYTRTKTGSRRKDKAFISIKVEHEAQALIEKYKDPDGKRVLRFYKEYTHPDGFSKTLNAGLKTIQEHLKLKVDLTFYYARYSWPNLARNECGVSKDDVAMAMNHSTDEHKTTDIYLKKDWVLIDVANQKVLSYLRENTVPGS